METKLPPASTPTSPSSPGLSPVPPPDKVDGFSRRSLRRARPRRSHSSSQFRYQSNQQELTPLPLLKGELLPPAKVPEPRRYRGEDRGRNNYQVESGYPFRLGTPLELTPASSPLLTHGLTGLSSLEVGHLEVVPGAGKGQGWGAQPTFQEAPISPASCLALGIGPWHDSL